MRRGYGTYIVASIQAYIHTSKTPQVDSFRPHTQCTHTHTHSHSRTLLCRCAHNVSGNQADSMYACTCLCEDSTYGDCIHMHLYIYIYTHTFVCLLMYTYTSIHTYVHIYILCLFVHLFIYTHVSTYMPTHSLSNMFQAHVSA